MTTLRYLVSLNSVVIGSC